MEMSIDANKIVDNLSDTELKKNYSIGVTPSVMKEFKAACDLLSAKRKKKFHYSPVIEELMKEFIESARKQK